MPTVHEFEMWCSTPQAADRLGVSRQAVHKMLKQKRLRFAATSLGPLIDPASVEDMKARRGEGRAGR